MKLMNSALSKNIFFNAFGNLFYLGIQWLLTFIVTTKMGFEQAGYFSLAMSVSAVFQALALFGIRNYQVSDLNNEFSDQGYYEARFITCIASFLFCAVFCVANNYSSAITVAICGMMLFRIAECFSDVLHGMLQKKEKLYLVGISFTLRGIMILFGFLTVMILTKNIIAVIWSMVITSFIITIGFDLKKASCISSIHIPRRISLDVIHLLKKTFPLCLYQFFSAMLVSVPKYMLERILDNTSLGIYSAVFTPVMLIQAVSCYLFLPFAGRFAVAWEKHDRSVFLKTALKLVAVISGFSSVVLVAAYMGKDLLIILFGNGISDHTGLLVYAVICSLLVSLYNLSGMLEIILRDRIYLTFAGLIGVIVSCVLLPGMINKYGINGANIGQITGLSVALILMIIRIVILLRKSEKS